MKTSSPAQWDYDADGNWAPYVARNGKRMPVTWAPQSGSQVAFLKCKTFEVLLEGNRGGGKTDTLLMDFAQHCGRGWGAEWRGILFRQTYPQLEEVEAKAKKWFPRIFKGIEYNQSKMVWRWPTGETLRMSHIMRDADYWNYHGHQYPWIGWEELTTWATPSLYLKMMSCCRSTVPGIPRKVRATTNPYGPGHNWVKHRFSLPIPPGDILGPIIRKEDEPDRRAIRGHLDENQILLKGDPAYKDRIRAAARNPAELKAWLEGSWDIVAGGMFDDVWEPATHVIKPFTIPASWRLDRSFDWGSSKPFSVGWWAESDGCDITLADGTRQPTVRGDLYRIAEWYGSTGEPNEGLRMLAVDIAKSIIQREEQMGIAGRVRPGPADSSIFAAENGVSIAYDMSRAGVAWAAADKRAGSRKTGWEQMRTRLKAAIKGDGPRESPGLFVFDRCRDFIRTVPVLPRDDKDMDDLDTESEDHIADETRYRIRASGMRASSGRTRGMV